MTRLRGALVPSWGRLGPPWHLHRRLQIVERFWHRFLDDFSVILGAVERLARPKMIPKIDYRFHRALPERLIELAMFPISLLNGFLVDLYQFFKDVRMNCR